MIQSWRASRPLFFHDSQIRVYFCIVVVCSLVLMAYRLATSDAGLELVRAAAESLEMRPAVRLRDGVWRDGRLHDMLFYEFLNPVWTARLGDPGPITSMSARPVATTSSGTWPFAISCASTPKRRRGTRR